VIFRAAASCGGAGIVQLRVPAVVTAVTTSSTGYAMATPSGGRKRNAPVEQHCPPGRRTHFSRQVVL